VRREAMQPHGVLAGDFLRDHAGAFVQTETCNVAAHIWSHLLLLIVGGEGVIADRIERAVFNAAPATVNREFTWNTYWQTPNHMTQSLPGRTRYGPGAFCCGASVNRMVPYYLTHMWMATYDNGLVAAHYGPCRLSARAGDGVPVEIDCRTSYPFDDAIDMTVKPAQEVVFPLSLRIPGWCKQPLITINGTAVPAAPDAKGFVRIERTWKSGDALRIRFPMSIQMETGVDKSGTQPAPYATISYGPLLMALPIADTKDVNTPDLTVKWNYALIADSDKAEGEMTVARTPMPAKWDWPLASPLVIRVPAVAFDWKPTWAKKGERQALPPAVVAPGPKETIALVPYGCTKFRVSMFPVFQSKALP